MDDFPSRPIIRQLVPHRGAKLVNLGSHSLLFEHLFGTKCNEHAQDYDPYLARKLAPAVQRLRQMEMHTAGPRRAQANRCCCRGNGAARLMADWVESGRCANGSNGWKAALAGEL